MNKIIKFSIIIPVYNVASYLKACLDSLLIAIKSALEKEDFLVEIICINDGSTDGSDSILKEYASVFDDVSQQINYHFYTQTNKGLGATRNEGLEKAKGDWILFVDSDDTVDQNYLLSIIDVIKDFNSSVISFKFQMVQSFDHLICQKNCKADSYLTQNAKEIYQILISSTVCNMCYRREIIGNIRFANITPGEDSLFNASILSKVENIAVISSVLYYYLQRPNSLMHKKNVSLSQIKSCMRAFGGRIQCVLRWKDFSTVKNDVYKFVRTTYIGQDGQMVLAVKENKREAWKEYCKLGKKIFAPNAYYIPYLVRMLGCLAFKYESRILWYLFLYFPVQVRVWLLKLSVVRKIKKLIWES